MKTLIVYGTKYGCTKRCSELLKSFLNDDVVILPVKNIKVNLNDYDTVFVGGSVYMGKIQKEVTRFCKHNEKLLLQKKLGLYACCYTSKDTDEFLRTLFPPQLITHASYITTVGGEMDYLKMNFIYRKMFQVLKKIDGFNNGFIEPQLNMIEIKKLAEIMTK